MVWHIRPGHYSHLSVIYKLLSRPNFECQRLKWLRRNCAGAPPSLPVTGHTGAAQRHGGLESAIKQLTHDVVFEWWFRQWNVSHCMDSHQWLPGWPSRLPGCISTFRTRHSCSWRTEWYHCLHLIQWWLVWLILPWMSMHSRKLVVCTLCMKMKEEQAKDVIDVLKKLWLV